MSMKQADVDTLVRAYRRINKKMEQEEVLRQDKSSARQRAHRGKTWFSVQVLDGLDNVDCDELDMGHGDHCILGQWWNKMDHDWDYYPQGYGDAVGYLELTNHQAIYLGFQANAGGSMDYNELTEAWKKELGCE